MTVTVDSIVQDIIKSPIGLQHVGAGALRSVWENTCAYLDRQLSSGKGVSIPNFGTFTFNVSRLEVGNKGTKDTKTPVFVMADKFLRVAAVRYKRPQHSGSIPIQPVNTILIAQMAGQSKDVVSTFLREFVTALSDACRCGNDVNIDFRFCRFSSRASMVSLKFYPGFINKIQDINDQSKHHTVRAHTGSRRPFTPNMDLSNSFDRPASRAGSDAGGMGENLPPSRGSSRPASRAGSERGMTPPSRGSRRPSSRNGASPMHYPTATPGEAYGEHDFGAEDHDFVPNVNISDKSCEICYSRAHQIEEKRALQQKEHEIDRMLTQEALRRTEYEIHKEAERVKAQRQTRIDIERFNQERLRKENEERKKKKIISSKPNGGKAWELAVPDDATAGDLFANRQEPQPQYTAKELQKILKQQMKLRDERKRRDKLQDQQYQAEQTMRVQEQLAEEQHRFSEEKRMRHTQQANALAEQIRTRNPQIPVAAGNALDNHFKAHSEHDPDAIRRRKQHAIDVQRQQLAQMAQKRAIVRQNKLSEQEDALREAARAKAELARERDEYEKRKVGLKNALTGAWRQQLDERTQISRNEEMLNASLRSTSLIVASDQREFEKTDDDNCDECRGNLVANALAKPKPNLLAKLNPAGF